MPSTLSPLKAIRLHCLDCVGGSAKLVRYCPCDGVHSTRCQLWPYRFGKRPETTKKRKGEWFIEPGLMPDGDMPLETVESFFDFPST